MIKCEKGKTEICGDLFRTIGPELVTLIGDLYDGIKDEIGEMDAETFICGCVQCAIHPDDIDTGAAAATLIAAGVTEPEDIGKLFGFFPD